MQLNQIMALTPNKECETIATGFRHLDYLTGGLRTGQLCTIAAPFRMDKTAFAVSLLRNIGVVQKVPTAYFSLEMNKEWIPEMLKASITGSWSPVPTPPVEVMNVMKEIGFHHRNVEQEAMRMMEEALVWIEDDFEADIDEIVRRMEQLHRENQVRLVIIDSISLLMFGCNHVEQTQTIKKLHQTADRLKQAVILTSAVNLSQEVSGKCKRPRSSDLCNGERVDPFSSVVMFVHRPEYYYFEIFKDDCDSLVFEMTENGITHLYKICDTFEDGTNALDMADIIVEKNIFGGTGCVRMHFDNHARFREVSLG